MLRSNTAPIHELPPGYHETEYWGLSRANYLLLNLFSIIPLVLAAVLMLAWTAFIIRLRGPWPDGTVNPNGFAGLAILMLVIPVHEYLHGLAIHWAGHRPRYGMKLSKMAFFATADNALFPRNDYLVVALAPLVGITLMGMVSMLLVSSATMAFYGALAVVVNAASAIGDLWMVRIALRYPPDVLIRDEADGMRLFTRASSSGLGKP